MAIGACIQNILLEITALKLGGCWLGEILNRKQDVQALLDLDEVLEVLAVIAVGFPAGKTRRTARRPLKELMIAPP